MVMMMVMVMCTMGLMWGSEDNFWELVLLAGPLLLLLLCILYLVG